MEEGEGGRKKREREGEGKERKKMRKGREERREGEWRNGKEWVFNYTL